MTRSALILTVTEGSGQYTQNKTFNIDILERGSVGPVFLQSHIIIPIGMLEQYTHQLQSFNETTLHRKKVTHDYPHAVLTSFSLVFLAAPGNSERHPDIV